MFPNPISPIMCFLKAYLKERYAMKFDIIRLGNRKLTDDTE